MRALQLLPGGRAQFEDLKIKPQNTFDDGLFVRDRRRERLRAGSTFPQGWVRSPASGTPLLSDDAIGSAWSLIGFGVDAHGGLAPQTLARWAAAGGRVWQWCHRGQAQHLAAPEGRLEALDEALLPTRVPLGWIVIVRPDRCVFAEGGLKDAQAMVLRALEMMGGSNERSAARSSLAAA
jgi:3-(3-hydroxy-phenyl)propionate hydroxylase